jgi:hypothetical protein
MRKAVSRRLSHSLGLDHDETRKEAYTTVDALRLYLSDGLASLLWQQSLAANKPFREMIAKYIDNALTTDRVAGERSISWQWLQPGYQP